MSPKPPQPGREPLPLEQKVIRGIAIGGAIITIIGVGLLIALAIQSGWLGPLGRVIGTAAFGALLLAAGLWLNSRRAESTAGVTALVTTSYLVFSLLVYTLVHWLSWWPELAGALVLVVIHVVYLGFSRRLNLVWLSYAVAIVGGFLAIFSQTYNPASWVTAVLPLLTLAATFRAGWLWTRVFSGIGTILLLIAGVNIALSDVPLWWNTLATVSFLAFLIIGVIDRFPAQESGGNPPTPQQPGEPMTAQYWQYRRQGPAPRSQPGPAAPVIDRNHFLLLIPTLILLVQLQFTSSSMFVWLVPILALVMVGIGWQSRRDLETIVGVCALPVSFVFIWAAGPPMGPLQPWTSSVILGLYLVLAMGLVAWLSGANRFGQLPWVVWLVALLIMTGPWAGDVMGRAPLWLTGYAAAPLAILLAGLIALCLIRYRAFGIFPVWAQVIGGVVILHLSTLVIVTLTTFLGDLVAGSAGMWLGYLLGHAAVSAAWMILGAVVLLARTPLDNRTELGIGVLLAAAATIKLVFFDLSALSGVPRVIAFLVCGVALLVIAAVRGRRTSSHSDGPGSAAGPADQNTRVETAPAATAGATDSPAARSPEDGRPDLD